MKIPVSPQEFKHTLILICVMLIGSLSNLNAAASNDGDVVVVHTDTPKSTTTTTVPRHTPMQGNIKIVYLEFLQNVNDVTKVWAGALVGGVIGGLTGWASGAMASFSQANNIWAGALVGAGTGASIGAASSFLSVGFNNLLNGRNFSENLWSSVGSSAFTGGVTGAISGGIETYESCRERNINPFTGESNRESFSNIVEGHMQPDPTRGCYEYAGEYASEQVGKPHTAESIGAACDNADGMDVAHAWDKMQCGIKYARYSTFLKDTDLSQFADAFDRGKMTAELTISTSSSSTNHVVTLNKFDTVIKHNWFGTGMHTVMSRIHVFDPLTGNTVRFYGNLITFDLIH